MRDPGPGDRIQFREWVTYKDEVPLQDPEQYTGTVLETWGICRLSLTVKRDADGRCVPMFVEDVVRVIQRQADVPRHVFAAAAGGYISATESTKKKTASKRRSKR